MLRTKTLAALFLFSMLAACGGGSSEQTIPAAKPAGQTSETIGEHVVHFNALTTDQLTPEIAKVYNIVRSKDRAIINVSIVEAATGKAVAADVSVKTRTVFNQVTDIVMRRINEGNAIYYIGDTKVEHRDALKFEISVKPEGADQAYEVVFQREFYTD